MEAASRLVTRTNIVRPKQSVEKVIIGEDTSWGYTLAGVAKPGVGEYRKIPLPRNLKGVPS